jgi:L-aminopeptidase/D-esterase-like protein
MTSPHLTVGQHGPVSSTLLPTSGSLVDVVGVQVGHFERRGRGWLTGTTVVLTPAGAVAGVDVRGGAPGTRETDLLRPENLVQQIHGLCLTGGSAFGLAAADGVMASLAERNIGFPIGTEPGHVVPIVPGAVIFDLGRGGSWNNRPTADFGARAAATASRRPVAEGTIGAGTGARSGGIKGGTGTASVRLGDGTIVAALAIVNSIGSVIDMTTGLPFHAVPVLALRRPTASERHVLAEAIQPPALPLNTTIGVVATDATLTPAEAHKFAQVAHDGLARAVRPAHLMNDGDTIFSLATCTREGPATETETPRHVWLNELLAASADVFATATVRGVATATAAPGLPSYRSLCPSAFEPQGRARAL